MRTFLFVTLFVLVGAALGAGLALRQFKSQPWDKTKDQGTDARGAADTLAPKVVVDHSQHRFESLENNVAAHHAFTFTNRGKSPLTLHAVGDAEKHVEIVFQRAELPPGQSTKANVTWTPTNQRGLAEQSVTVQTNDPDRPEVRLQLVGGIKKAIRAPYELTINDLSISDTGTTSARLYSALDEPLKIVSHKWSGKTDASQFDVEVRPLSADELKEVAGARNGVDVRVTVKPGLPPGPVKQKLELQTNVVSQPTVALPFEFTITSDISLVGVGWHANTNTLMLGQISPQKGLERSVLLMVRGPLRRDVRFEITGVHPSLVKASLGQPRETNAGAAVEVPLKIEIPAGSSPASYMGSKPGERGDITIKTTHPKVPEFPIHLSFAILE